MKNSNTKPIIDFSSIDLDSNDLEYFATKEAEEAKMMLEIESMEKLHQELLQKNLERGYFS